MSIIKSAFDGEKDIATGQASWKITTIKMIFYNLVFEESRYLLQVKYLPSLQAPFKILIQAKSQSH